MTTVCTAGPSGAVSSAGVKFMQPVNLAKLPGSGQKMMAFKAANGNFLFRDSSGKLIQLMPLSQYKALKSNVMPQQCKRVHVYYTCNNIITNCNNYLMLIHIMKRTIF